MCHYYYKTSQYDTQPTLNLENVVGTVDINELTKLDPASYGCLFALPICGVDAVPQCASAQRCW